MIRKDWEGLQPFYTLYPKEICQILMGCRLIGFNTKDGGVRSIAIGFFLRRRVSKYDNITLQLITRMASLLHPILAYSDQE